jgi:hypothetical protein
MGDNYFAALIRAAAAGDPHAAAAIVHMMRCHPAELDDDDFQLLEDLLAGELRRNRGGRGPSYPERQMRRAEAAAWHWRAAHGGTREAAAKAVAPAYKVPASMLFNRMRGRTKKHRDLLLRLPRAKEV